ncbi:MAG: fasciclin domain-containing protein [Pseudomonadota bacterium]
MSVNKGKKRNLDLVIVAWGDWHISVMNDFMFPSALSDNNLPALAQLFSLKFVFLTHINDVDSIKALRCMQQLRSYGKVVINAAPGAGELISTYQMEAWHQARKDAFNAGNLIFNLWPDVIWPDGAMMNQCKPLLEGKKASLCPPHIRVAKESIANDINAFKKSDNIISINPYEAISFAKQHLQQQSAAAMDKVNNARPALDHIWPVEDEGFLLFETGREIIAYDPAFVDLNDCFLITNLTTEDIHISDSNEDCFILSIAPLAKDWGYLIKDFSVSKSFLARWSLHPANESYLNEYLGRRIVKLYEKEPTKELWERKENEVKIWLKGYENWLGIYRVFQEIQKNPQCKMMLGIFGLLMNALDIPKLVSYQDNLSFFIPTDSALKKINQDKLLRLFAIDNNDKSEELFISHVKKGVLFGSESNSPANFENIKGNKFDLIKFGISEEGKYKTRSVLSDGEISAKILSHSMVGKYQIIYVDSLLMNI